MRTWISIFAGAAVGLLVGSACYAGDLGWSEWSTIEGIDFGGFIDEMHAVRVIVGEKETDRRILFGDRQGQIHAVRFKGGRFKEEWVSQPLRSAIAEIFIDDINADGSLEIVAYSEFGDIALYRADDYQLTWQSTDDMYATISAMALANVDDDPQMELVYCAEQRSDVAAFRANVRGSPEEIERHREQEISRLFVFDCRELFTEWESEQGLSARSILVGDLDDDGYMEIALNTGFVVDANYRSVEWQYPDGFGQKIGAADIDGDGVPELIGEYHSPTRPRRYLRFFDVDHQTESFLSPGR